MDADLDTGGASASGTAVCIIWGMLDRTAVAAGAVRAQVERVPASTTR